MNKTIEYYSKDANKFAEEYEKISPEKVHEHWLQFLPFAKAQILDIGAGSGRDAAWFVKMGHEVVAVEPADCLRQKAQELHCDTSIQWIDDYLPTLRKIYELGLKFDLILLCAVWMHIAPGALVRGQ
jgi:protein-L-isoaspartate O-methyltransferase